MTGGICGRCGKEFPATIRYCGCNAETVKRHIKEQRAKHLKTWIKVRYKEIISTKARIAEMEEELKNI